MKKIITALLAGLLAAGSALALDVEVSGEIKTGFFAEWREMKGESASYARIYNSDGDSGAAEGRIRLGLALQEENFGMRTRFYRQEFKAKNNKFDSSSNIGVDFAYAYGTMLDNQIKISAGLLGESPWGTGGPDLIKELETTGNDPILGIRTEWKPLGFLRGLNLGFVLNRDNDTPPSSAKEKFGDIFAETVAGIAYEHDFFALRFAYRFNRELESPAAIVNGSQLVYRVEERALEKFVPGISVWANGYCKGIGAKVINSQGATETFIQNWFYARYDPENFTVGIDVRYEDWFEDKDNKQFLEIRPSFYYKLFNNILNVGVRGGMEFGFNNGRYFREGAVYNFWFVEPQIKANLKSNFYTALVYRYTSGYYTGNPSFEEDQETHWFNLRVCFTF